MQFTKRFSAVVGTIALGLVSFLVTTTQSQEDTKKGTETAKTEAGKPDTKKRAEPKGRLPAYYGEIVDKEQREKIYAIQGKYLADIKKLQEQLENAIEERDNEVEAVLTAEQKEKLTKLVADAKAKRSATKKKPEATATSTATTPAATTPAAEEKK